jgi:hypothetical protein
MSSTLTVARRQFYDDLAGYEFGFNFTGINPCGAANTKTLDHRFMLGGTSAVAERFRGGHLFWPGSIAAERKRIADSLSVAAGVATLTHYGPDRTEVTLTDVEILSMDPDELIRMFGDALNGLKVDCFVPLGHGPTDGDMQKSLHADWDDTTATFEKQTTASEVFAGARSGTLTLSAGGGYTQAATTYRMGSSKSGWMHAIAKADIGTGIYRIVDSGGTTVQSISFSQESWLYMTKQFSLSSTQELIRPRLMGTDNLDQIDWQSAWFVKDGEYLFDAPSWLGERDELRGLAVGRLGGAGPDDDTYLAAGMQFDELKEGVDYQFIRRFADATPHQIRLLNKGLISRPLFTIVACPYSAPYGVSAAFTAESDTTTCPLDLLLAQMKILLGERYGQRFPGLYDKGVTEKITALSKAMSPLPPEQNTWPMAFGGSL